MKPRIGLKRVASRIKFLVADFIQHRLSDPRKGFVTVTKIELKPDYRRCTISVSILGPPADQSKTMHMLEHATALIQRHVASNLSTRVTPALTFVQDKSIEKSMRMESIFDRIAQERQDNDSSEDLTDSDDEVTDDQATDEAESSDETQSESQEPAADEDREESQA